MWIFLNDAFLSIVEKGNDTSRLIVRARLPGDIERVFHGAVVVETPKADYRFRASLPREVVACALADRVRAIDYPNFKDSVESHSRYLAYARVWSIMLAEQYVGEQR